MSGHLAETLRFWARRFPDRLALRYPRQDFTWRQLDTAVDELAAGFDAGGVRPGDVIGILMSNRVEFTLSTLAAFRVGAIVELLNVRFTPAEMVHPIVDAGTSLVVTEAKLVGILEQAREALPEMKVYSVDPADGCADFSTLQAAGGTPPHRFADPRETAILAYTSGTTGTPKGAMLSHASIVENGSARATADAITWQDRTLVIMPLAFTGGTSTYLRESIVTGATAIVEETFDAERVLQLLQREKITICSAVPVLWERMLTLPEFQSADLSALRACMSAGATTPIEVIRAWQANGVGMRQGYGQTEAAGGYVTLLYEDEAADRIGSVGRALLGHEIRVVDETDADLPPGTPGEVIVRSPSTMTGYWNNPSATARTIVDGWLHTGDVGVLDDEGYLTIVDRTKDMLISGGLNVYSAEIESTITGLPGLEECAIIAVADKRWGQVPMIVVPSADGIDVESLKMSIVERLADYKRPRWLTETGEPLPRTLGGKILKRDLRDRFPVAPSGAISLK